MKNSIRVVKHDARYICALPVSVIKDGCLSWESVAVLAYLISKPANWKVVPQDICNRSVDGRDKVYGILNELIFYGYIKRTQEGNKIRYYVSETPVFLKQPEYIPTVNILKSSRKTEPFVIVDVELLNNTRLSWRDKGILCCLLSMKDGIFNSKALEKNCGSAAVKTSLRKIRKHGYIEIKSQRVKGMFNGYEYIIYGKSQGSFSPDLIPSGYKAEEVKPEEGKADNRYIDHKVYINNSSSNADIIDIFKKEFQHYVGPMQESIILELVAKYGRQLVLEALKRAVLNGKLFLSYVIGVLKNWTKTNLRSITDVEKHEQQYKCRQKHKHSRYKGKYLSKKTDDGYEAVYIT